MTHARKSSGAAAIAAAGLLLLSTLDPVLAVETPSSYGEAAKVDTPILRVPFARKPPAIDGTMAEGEWEDSASLSGFWYDYASAKFLFLAPIQTQLQIYAAYDTENLYIAYSSPVFPENSWLKARGRFPDVSHHPLYGLIWDDHVELELRPYHDIAAGFQLGLFKWFINPLGTTCDQYWSVTGGEGDRWQSTARIRCGVTGTRWIIEAAIPLKTMVYGNYTGKDERGNPLVKLPAPDGTAFRCWFTRGISGNQTFFNVFDAHVWNTTKTMLIFDSKSPVFQINELGPIMEDVVDLRLTVKNHNSRSETVRIGFFVESEEGLVYSSYEASELKDGLVELVPGEVRKLRLRKPFPGISTDGNVLWFDVRSAGRPAKTLFRTRLIRFHSMDGGAVAHGDHVVSFRDRRVNVIKGLRPPRRDFEFNYTVSTYTKRLSAVADIGIYGGSEDSRRAEEVKLIVMKNNPDEDVVKEVIAPFRRDFACFLIDLPELVDGESYKISLLLFDENKRIVGERNPEPFTFRIPVWQSNRIGLDDIVWDPFVPIQKLSDGLETLKHRFTVAPSGLPAQIYIKPDVRELPLDKRAPDAKLTDADLLEVGRGPQLRSPVRLEVAVDGKRIGQKVVQPAKLVREWKSEYEYASKLKVGPLEVDVSTRYDCDGSMHCAITYGSKRPAKVNGFEMLMDVAGLVDLALSGAHGGGMAGADVWQCRLPMNEGVVWDSIKLDYPDLYYSHFVPWFWFGSGDRAFTWYCDTDQPWLIDREESTMALVRNADREITWRVKFVNHEVEVQGQRTVEFGLLTHPAKPKPEGFRKIAWLYRGGAWADEFPGGDLLKSDENLLGKARVMARSLSGLPNNTPESVIRKWRPDKLPYWRYYQLRSTCNISNLPQKKAETREERYKQRWQELRIGGEMDQTFEDKFAYYFERHIRIGRRHGWWWDETWPTYRSNNVAAGNAYFRDPAEVKEKELPWQDCFLTTHMRSLQKRLARVFKVNNLPCANYLWANNSATCFEAFAWDTMLVEECGCDHRSFEVDMVTQFPDSLYRYMAHNYTGLVARSAPGPTVARHGDDKRLDRQRLGRALLNDMGVLMVGPHGHFIHKEQAVRLINALKDFGYFEDQATEMIPFWRSQSVIQFGDGTKAEKAESILDQVAGDVLITVYRRPLSDGRKGYRALIVIMNETRRPVQAPLTLLKPERVLGGPGTLKAGRVRAKTSVPEELGTWWSELASRDEDATVLMDVETGDVVARLAGDPEAYGPVHVGYHDYRLLYAEREE